MPPDFSRIRFLKSAQGPADFPPEAGPEIAFAGRSNAGKSSALNALAGQGALARVSKTPGRTQLINFFELENGARLVDLPGYGYAKVPAAMREQWRELIERYVEDRRTLRGLVVLMDARHPLSDLDRQLLAWLARLGRPVHIVLTKADKLTRAAAAATLASVRRSLPAMHGEAGVQLFSAPAKMGREELLARMQRWLGEDAAEEGKA